MSAFPPQAPVSDEQVLSTLSGDGSRRFLHPRLSAGRLWKRRRALAWALILFFNVLPWVRVNGEPLILLDVIARRFTLFGTTFRPTDTLPLAFLVLSIFLAVFLVTAICGRLFCGWVCPQTVYTEFLFRPIERFFYGRTGVGGMPKRGVPLWRRIGLYAVYVVLCAHLTNTFLAYFVGTDNLTRWIWTSPPTEHPIAFTFFVAATAALLFHFAYWREQLCMIACPYGRFQSVMLDRDSLIVSYDPARGEPRGKPRKRKKKRAAADGTLPDVSLPVAKVGDCVDCHACVDVCPTGIDIRDGLQMECVHCTQCIDACNDIMRRFDRPEGLIRYSSQNLIDGQKPRWIRPRVVLYPLALVVVLSLLAWSLLTREAADVEVLRGLGRPFVLTAEGQVENGLRVKITNRTDETRRYQLATSTPGAELRTPGENLVLAPGETVTQPVRVLIPRDRFVGGRLSSELEIRDDAGWSLTRPVRLQGPTAPAAQPQPEPAPAEPPADRAPSTASPSPSPPSPPSPPPTP